MTTQLYVTRGTLVRLRDEAELAALLGHEIGHVIAGHMFETGAEMSNGMRDQSRDLVSQRDDEIQADELAVLYMHELGYDVTAAERMLRALQAGQEDSGDGTHPRIEERVTRLRAYAWRFRGGVRNEDAYRARIAGLVVGEDPRIDAIVDKVMVFSSFDVAIPLPKNFAIAMASATDIDVSLKEDDTSIRVSNVLARAAPQMLADKKKVAGYAITRGDRALVIMVGGPRREAVLADMKSGMRAVTPAERVKLVPQIVNLSSRAMWPESPHESYELTFAMNFDKPKA
ncbi:MAG: M48 family metalloprotease [Kofleriaceae bacterium]